MAKTAKTRDKTTRLEDLPFIVLVMAVGSAGMAAPAAYALATGDFVVARAFLFAMMMSLVLTLLIGLATRGQRRADLGKTQLTALLGSFAILPVLFAVPFHEAVPDLSFLHAWFEMISSFTTTGATLFDDPGDIAPALHLWRATVGWLGGLLIWIVALAVFAPMNIGGFEVRAAARGEDPSLGQLAGRHLHAPSERLVRFGAKLMPIYVMLTLALWVALLLAGETPLTAICHAMSVLATSGISPVGGTQFAGSGLAGELVIFAFLVFGVSRLTFSRGLLSDDDRALWRDPEIRIAVVLVVVIPLLLFARHYVGAVEDRGAGNAGAAFAALWGSIFTVLSFLTTTGFESVQWVRATDWSGLETPGLILVGLALVGGGVATTAGGVKLLRVYALLRHGEREIGRLIHPNSVGGSGQTARRIRRQGARIAWIFFMLFALSVAVVMLLLALTGVQFETAMILAVSALSTTGPLATVAAENPISYAGIPDLAKVILGMVMVLGRLETLALVALLNAEFWRG